MTTILRFFSDPHEGRELKSNTTPASRALLQSQLHAHAMQAATLAHPMGWAVAGTLCGGDLFDTDSNPEHVLLQGAAVAGLCDLVMGGNHDVVNIVGRESSLSALALLTGRERFVMPPGPGQVRYQHWQVGDVDVFSVPHHSLQQHFELALDKAAAEASKSPTSRKLLLLHCNYHLTMGVGENDLNLTDAKARLLLKTFDFIVLGHDHRARFECEGRLLILGNTHPTSFADQGEKFVWFYNSETNSWCNSTNCEDSSRKMEAAELIEMHREGSLQALSNVEWLDLQGELPPEAAVDLAKAIRATWKEAPFMYAIRASKVLFKVVGLTEGVTVEAAQKTLLELVEEDLSRSPDLLALFNEAKEGRE